VGDKGVVNIASPDKTAIDAALARIRRITFTPEEGDVYRAVVKSVMPYGAFVDFSGKSGLLHVSEISHSRVENVEDYLKEGDEVEVKLIEIDKKTGKMRLSMKALQPAPPKSGGDKGASGDGGGERRDRDRDRRDGGNNRDRRDRRD
jgi:polyribonucleotide nucleotidyltransferase